MADTRFEPFNPDFATTGLLVSFGSLSVVIAVAWRNDVTKLASGFFSSFDFGQFLAK